MSPQFGRTAHQRHRRKQTGGAHSHCGKLRAAHDFSGSSDWSGKNGYSGHAFSLSEACPAVFAQNLPIISVAGKAAQAGIGQSLMAVVGEASFAM
ncbi:MAG TPA: hypothetical protein VFW87_25670 [Pirellulales bacterium]|nr:hypothetical protein [Pirellulales bacterium]